MWGGGNEGAGNRRRKEYLRRGVPRTLHKNLHVTRNHLCVPLRLVLGLPTFAVDWVVALTGCQSSARFQSAIPTFFRILSTSYHSVPVTPILL